MPFERPTAVVVGVDAGLAAGVVEPQCRQVSVAGRSAD